MSDEINVLSLELWPKEPKKILEDYLNIYSGVAFETVNLEMNSGTKIY
jgi:hypothetical protein